MPSTPKLPFWGTLRDVKPRHGGTKTWIGTFCGELRMATPLPPVAVEMRGYGFEGTLSEGDRVTLEPTRHFYRKARPHEGSDFNPKDVT